MEPEPIQYSVPSGNGHGGGGKDLALPLGLTNFPSMVTRQAFDVTVARRRSDYTLPLKKKKKMLCVPGWLRNFDGAGGPSLEEEWHLALVSEFVELAAGRAQAPGRPREFWVMAMPHLRFLPPSLASRVPEASPVPGWPAAQRFRTAWLGGAVPGTASLRTFSPRGARRSCGRSPGARSRSRRCR